MNVKHLVYDMLEEDHEKGGSGLSTLVLWQRLPKDEQVEYRIVEENLSGLHRDGFVEGGDISITDGMHRSVWSVAPGRIEDMKALREKEAARLKALGEPLVVELLEKPAVSSTCPHCGHTGFIMGGWCTVCMERIPS